MNKLSILLVGFLICGGYVCADELCESREEAFEHREEEWRCMLGVVLKHNREHGVMVEDMNWLRQAGSDMDLDDGMSDLEFSRLSLGYVQSGEDDDDFEGEVDIVEEFKKVMVPGGECWQLFESKGVSCNIEYDTAMRRMKEIHAEVMAVPCEG